MKFLIIGLFFAIVFLPLIFQAVTRMDVTPVIVKMEKKQCFWVDSFFVGENGDCHGVCPNREKKDGWCALKQCPPDKPLQDRFGTCHTCAQTDVISVGSLPCESICPNRISTNQGVCLLKQCPPDKPLRRDWEGSCFGCDEPQIVTLENEEDCKNLCPNRKIVNSWHGCALKKCPKEFPLVDDLGGCHDCSADPRDVSYIPQNCGVCHFFKLFDKFCYKHEPGFSI